jgi:hypothetical protein
MEMDVVGDTGPGRFPQIHSKVEAVGAVDLAQAALYALSGEDHLLRGLRRESGEGVDVLVGQDEDVACGIGIGIKADEAERAAMDDVGGLFGGRLRHALGDGIVGGGDHVAKDAVLVLGDGPTTEGGRDAGAGLLVGAGDVVVAPGSPKMVHRSEYKLKIQRIRRIRANIG